MSTWNMPPGVPSADILGLGDPLVITEYIAPPIPMRSHDWAAFLRDPFDDSLTGYGPTECDALRDLAEKMALLYLESKP